MKSNQKGFSAVEGLLIFAGVAIIGGIGWYVMYSRNQADKVRASHSVKCTEEGVHSMLISSTKGTFKSYDSRNKVITYSAPGDSTIFGGWCKSPQVTDKNNQPIKLSDLRKGDSISVITAWDGIESIQKN